MERAARMYSAGNLEGASTLAEAILAADPRHFYALHLLATIAAKTGRHDDCVRLAGRALEIDPRHAEVLSNRGAALRALCRFEEALADYDRALEIAPNAASTLNNRGVTLAALGRHREALACYAQALAVAPDYPRARYNRALSRLMLGDYRGGWEDYEARWAGGESPAAPRPFAFPPLAEADLGGGHRVALWAEQGLGDQLLFSSLAAELAGRREAFVLEVDRRLLIPLRRAHPDWEIAAKEDSERAFAGCDRHLPLGSLPRLLRPTPESFRRQPAALLAVDAPRRERYRARIVSGDALAIGISWRSFQPATRAYYERTKSAPLDAFRPLSDDSRLRLVDLQYGDTAAERSAFVSSGGRLERVETLDLREDIDGLLALIGACDAVVTTSNATAHLAGAIGKRTLLVYPSAVPPFHYWVPNAAGRSPWYPTVEIVTGRALDTWPRLLAHVRDVLVGG